MKKAVIGLFIVSISSFALAQPLDARLESCNAIKNSRQRLDCLKAATAAPATSVTPAANIEPKISNVDKLDISSAATACEKLLTSFQSKHDLATEDIAKSSESDLAVTWPPNEGKAPMTCVVNRASRKIVAIYSSGMTIAGAQLAEMERDAGFRGEIKEGKYDNFVSFTKDSLTRSFKDPSSVQFRGLFISGKAMHALCGEVNGKNSYGAYVGFRRFYATGKSMLNSIESPSEKYVFERMWPSMCGDKLADIAD